MQFVFGAVIEVADEETAEKLVEEILEELREHHLSTKEAIELIGFDSVNQVLSAENLSSSTVPIPSKSFGRREDLE